MPKYKIVHTPVIHGKPMDTIGSIHLPGDVLDLEEDEAARLGDNVLPVSEEGKAAKSKP